MESNKRYIVRIYRITKVAVGRRFTLVLKYSLGGIEKRLILVGKVERYEVLGNSFIN